MSERRRSSEGLVSFPAPEYTPRISAKRPEQFTELERDFERGLKTGKERDLVLMMERIKWMILTIDQSSQHHEVPVSTEPLALFGLALSRLLAFQRRFCGLSKLPTELKH